MDQERAPDRRRVPISAALVLLSILFKRYSTAAISSILVLFLNLKLGYDKDVSTAIFHTYAFLASCFAVVGAIIADGCLGIALSVVGLMINAIGDGCHKPLNRTYGANQYHPSEVKSIALFFVLYYFVYNCGSITSRLISPVLRQNVQCFGNNDCFTLAFGISGICMILVAVLTIIANQYSETEQKEKSNLLKTLGCIWNAISVKSKSRTSRGTPAKSHWLEYSEEKYGKTLVWDTRIILHVIVLYLPITLFWALFYQQGSRWVFQAVRMNGDLGFYVIIPDQLNVLNPLLVLLMIPVFEKIILPLLEKVKISGDLQKVTVGGVLAGVAFIISAIVELQIQNGKYLHMAWLLPQYTLMAMGEILVTVPILNFSYTVSPSSMKTIIQGFNNLSIGLGNLIVAIVVGSKLIESQIYEFILFAGLMFVDMAIFALLAKRFKPLNENVEERVELMK